MRRPRRRIWRDWECSIFAAADMDGGLMVFLIIEKIKGSPVSIKVQVATQVVGLFLIIGAFLFVTYQDALRLWG